MRAALGGPQRAAALLLGLGMLSFAAGNIAYVALIRLEVEPPVPSLADIGYLGFYPLACAGALVIMRRGRVLSGTMWLDGLLGAVGAATALAALLNPVLSALSGGVGELVVAGAYPVGDLLLIAMLAGSLAIHGPRDRGTLSWLAARPAVLHRRRRRLRPAADLGELRDRDAAGRAVVDRHDRDGLRALAADPPAGRAARLGRRARRPAGLDRDRGRRAAVGHRRARCRR